MPCAEKSHVRQSQPMRGGCSPVSAGVQAAGHLRSQLTLCRSHRGLTHTPPPPLLLSLSHASLVCGAMHGAALPPVSVQAKPRDMVDVRSEKTEKRCELVYSGCVSSLPPYAGVSERLYAPIVWEGVFPLQLFRDGGAGGAVFLQMIRCSTGMSLIPGGPTPSIDRRPPFGGRSHTLQGPNSTSFQGEIFFSKPALGSTADGNWLPEFNLATRDTRLQAKRPRSLAGEIERSHQGRSRTSCGSGSHQDRSRTSCGW